MATSSQRATIALLAVSNADVDAAQALAGRLALPLLPADSDPHYCAGVDAVLLVDAGQLALQRTGRGAPGPVRVDFGSDAMRHRRRGGHNELLGRAVGVGRKAALRVLDATAGLGRDAFVLADLGCAVTLCEREPVIAEMLRAGMAPRGDAWLDEVLGRLQLLATDARKLDPLALEIQDVIYLDPMFPGRDKSAAVKKEMVLLQLLLADSEPGRDADDLLRWALASGVERVVVKRPPRAPCLAAERPSHSIGGKAVRYDVYQRPKSA